MKNDDRIGFGVLHVVFGDEYPSEEIQNANAFMILSDFGEKWITFGEILEICKKNGYSGGWITVIAENPLSGAVYRRCGEGDWRKVGTTIGYERWRERNVSQGETEYIAHVR